MNLAQTQMLNPHRAIPSSLPRTGRDEATPSQTFGTIEHSQSLMGNSAVAAAASNRSWMRSPPMLSSGGFASSDRRQPAVGNSAFAHALGSTPIQAKLTVNQPGDAYEQEADRVAAHVVSRVAGPTLQRKCALCNGAGTCPKCKQVAPRIQRKSDADGSREIESETAAELDRLRSGGQALSSNLRDDLEPHFGQDFGQVRVHTDGHAADLASAVGARAFTSGRDIVFGQGQYQPGSTEGKRLLAHELTHVVQQGAATPAGPASSFDGPGTHITHAGTQQIQCDWLDDAKAAASDAYDSAASTVGAGYDAAASAVGAGATAVAEGAKAAVDTISSAGQAAGSFVSDVGKTVSDDPEKTRAHLLGQVNATQQKVQVADPDTLRAGASHIASMNQHISSLNAALVPAAVPLIPLLAPEAPAVGTGIGAVLVAIAAALGISVGWLLVIIAVIILAIIALIMYLLRDTKKFPEPTTGAKPDTKTDPKNKPKEDPKGGPEKKPGPVDPPPLPPEPDEILPDCCKDVFLPTLVTIDKRHRRYPARTIRVLDGRGKHSQNVKSNGQGASCDVEFLAAVLGQGPRKVGPCLRDWITAVGAHDADYGGQMGSDSAPASAAIVKDVVENGVEINPTRYWGDAGVLVGVDVATGNATTMARIDGLPSKAHVIPQESKPT